MKNNFNLTKITLVLFILFYSSKLIAQSCTGMSGEITLKNIVVTSNTLEYDIYIKNTGTTTLNLAGFNGNVLYPVGLLGTGTGTFTVVQAPSACDFPTLPTPVLTHTAASGQLRYTQTIQNYASGNQVPMPIGVEMKFARYKLTNSVPFALSSFTLTLPTAVSSTYTRNNLTVTCNGNTNTTNLVGATNTLTVGGPYTLYVPNCISATVWNGTSWSNGTPSSTVQAVFEDDYTLNTDLTACNVQIINNSVLKIGSGYTLTVQNEITANEGSSVEVENNGAIIQVNNNSNSGEFKINRNSAPMIRLDYTAWSSPVTGQNLLNFSPNTLTNRFYTYDYNGTTSTTAYVSVDPTTNSFNSGTGYLIRSANDWSTNTYTSFGGSFSGVINNGTFNANVGTGFNMLGNPYPSPINAQTFLTDNTNVGALYFWTHTVPQSGSYVAKSNYATYTNLGGTAAATGGEIPNGFIQTGQGFYVNATNSNNIQFNNAQRVAASSSSQFFKNVTNSISADKIWINLKSETELFNQILIGYSDQTTNSFDFGYDGLLFNTEISAISSLINNEKYAIQGRSYPFVNTDVVPLGLFIETAGNYNINLENKTGELTNQTVYIKDNLLNSIQELNSTGYSFYSDAGNFNTRFEIVYQNSTLGNNTFSPNGFSILTKKNTIKINSSSEEINEILVFDLLGKKIFSKKDINSNFYQFDLNSPNAIYLIKVISKNNTIHQDKISIN